VRQHLRGLSFEEHNMLCVFRKMVPILVVHSRLGKLTLSLRRVFLLKYQLVVFDAAVLVCGCWPQALVLPLLAFRQLGHFLLGKCRVTRRFAR